MPEFTGERVIPGEVDPDLWNEHFARYLFASRLSRGKAVLDIACGTGYGTATLAHSAYAVTGIDISPEAVSYAAQHYRAPNLSFLQASCSALPFPAQSFDLITAFEVIEHLADGTPLLEEARRLLRPAGQFLVSTPNAAYYAGARRESGPNPFHCHEFTYEEFLDLLRAHFPHVCLFSQNHSTSVVFQPLQPTTATELKLEPLPADPATCHFFFAVCAMIPQTGAPTFAYLPASGNVLRERELHIERLQGEVAVKDRWLEKLQADHQDLVDQHTRQTGDLEAKNRWAQRLDSELREAANRITELQQELAAEQAAAAATVAAYEAKLAELEDINRQKTLWAQDTEQRLTAEIEQRSQELARCVQLLHEAEATLEERTRWALQLNDRIDELERSLRLYQASRWLRVGRRLGLGPEVPAL